MGIIVKLLKHYFLFCSDAHTDNAREMGIAAMGRHVKDLSADFDTFELLLMEWPCGLKVFLSLTIDFLNFVYLKVQYVPFFKSKIWFSIFWVIKITIIELVDDVLQKFISCVRNFLF